MTNREIRLLFLDKYDFQQRRANFTADQIKMIEKQAEQFNCSFEEMVSIIMETYLTQLLMERADRIAPRN